MKLQKLILCTLTVSCVMSSQQTYAAEDIGRFTKRVLLLSAPFLVRTLIQKNVIKHNRYIRDIITGAVAAVCWPEALK